MKIYYITPEMPLSNEGELLSQMLEAGLERVHLRHPDCPLEIVKDILEHVPDSLRGKIVLHDFHNLAVDYGCGIHLNKRNLFVLSGYSGEVSCSCHSLEEIESKSADYYFISPIFDSISKTGYKASKFDEERLRNLLLTKHIVALGGITPDKFDLLREAGFSSVALSGYLTGEGKSSEIIKRLKICFNS